MATMSFKTTPDNLSQIEQWTNIHVRDFPPKYIPRLQSAFNFWLDIEERARDYEPPLLCIPHKQSVGPESGSSKGEPSHFSLILEL